MTTSTSIFYDTFKGNELPCDLVIENNSLLIYLQDTEKTLLIWNIKSFKSCELIGLNLKAVNGQHISQTIKCSGDIAKRIYHQWLSDELPEKVVNKGNAKIVALISTLFIAIVLIILACYFYLLPYVGEKAVTLIPVETEIEIGKSLAEKIEKESQQNDSANFCMQQFVKQLKFNSLYPIKVSIINSNDINAFALPGGNIFVYSSIIKKMKSANELIALIGHEQTHVNKRHSLKSICRSAAASFLFVTLFGDINGLSAGILSQAQEFEQLNYSRDLETEADDEGIQFMIRNKVNPIGMVQLLELLNKENTEMPGMMKYLSTHPETESRVLNVKSQMTSNVVFTNNEQLEMLFLKIKSKI
jgi:predicted Zn-dependent protease